MNYHLSWFKNLRETKEVLDAVTNGALPLSAAGLSAIHKALLVATAYESEGRPVLVITSDEAEATKMAEDLSALGIKAFVYPERDFTFRSIEVKSREYEHTRLRTLSNLLEGNICVVLASAAAASQFTIPPHELHERSITLRPGDTLSQNDAVSKLLHAGYTRAEQVEGAGQFAMRGGILDIFPPHAKYPVRLEFWGDEIDHINMIRKRVYHLHPVLNNQNPVMKALPQLGYERNKL